MEHKISEQDWHYSGYGDASLVRKERQCSCGKWLFRKEEELAHKVEVLWEERKQNHDGSTPDPSAPGLAGFGE